MKLQWMFSIAFASLIVLSACKKEVPNALPKVVISKPYLEDPKKRFAKESIPLVYSVYDKDGLSVVEVKITGGGRVFYTKTPAITGATLDVETTFKVDTVIPNSSKVNYMTCSARVTATDAEGATYTSTNTFKVFE